MLSNSGHDERGQYTGGQAGDQTGGEWSLVNWYQYPWDGGWNVILHHPSAEVRKWIAQLAVEAANNNNIGYDQNQRYTFWNQLSTVGFRPSNITVPCEADCSAGVAAIVKAVGYLLNSAALQGVSIYAWTGNLRPVLVGAGFEARTASQYLTGDSYLYAGDILLNETNHTCICVNDGSKVASSSSSSSSTTAKRKFKVGQISLGSTGKDVFRVQLLLKARGFYSDKLDSIFGRNTQTAVKAFQKAAGLTVDGICGPATWATLLGLKRDGEYYIIDVVKVGDYDNKSVFLLQQCLKALGYYKGELDWDFGPLTKEALIAFQKKANKSGAGLPTDGKFDAKTAEYMWG